MKHCLWEKGINTLKFFPRSYYINDISEMLDFLEDYKYTTVNYYINLLINIGINDFKQISIQSVRVGGNY